MNSTSNPQPNCCRLNTKKMTKFKQENYNNIYFNIICMVYSVSCFCSFEQIQKRQLLKLELLPLYPASSLCLSKKVPTTVTLAASSTTKGRYILTLVELSLSVTADPGLHLAFVYSFVGAHTVVFPYLCSSYTHSQRDWCLRIENNPRAVAWTPKAPALSHHFFPVGSITSGSQAKETSHFQDFKLLIECACLCCLFLCVWSL